MTWYSANSQPFGVSCAYLSERNLDNNNDFSIAIFLDLGKAFDTINHDIILDKMFFYGVRGIVFDWVKNYLSNREQYVSYDDEDSVKQPIKCGVPQGSILGPILFILYINDLCFTSEILKYILFADDTNLLYSNSNLNDLTKIMNTELCTISRWFKVNKLSLNINKTNYMIFGRNTKLFSETHKIITDSTEINRVKETKFLGVILDEKLKWNAQIKQIESKVSKGIGMMYQSKGRLDQRSLLTLYNSIIFPYLYYCVEVWGNTCSTRLCKLEKYKNKQFE